MQGNLLILIGHGLRSDALSDERYWPIHTPNLERLASRGLRVAANTACPTDPGGMISLFTGLHPRQHGVLHSESAFAVMSPLTGTFCHWLGEAGYHLAGVGCLGPLAGLMDQAIAVEDVSVIEPTDACAYGRAIRSQGLSEKIVEQRRQRLRTGLINPNRLLLDPESDIDGFIGSQAVKMTDRLPHDRPWALIVVFSGPANQLPPPTLYQTLIESRELGAGFIPADPMVINALVEPTVPRAQLQRLDRQTIGRIRADYLARVALIDHGVGRLASAVALRPDASRNWTLLSSDRGELLGEHGLLGHRSFLAGTVQVPMIVSPPADGQRSAPTQLDAMISSVDFAATIAALGGCDRPRELAGRSLLPLLYDEPIVGGHTFGLLSEFHDRLMLETQRYKAVFNRQTRRCLGIYDLLTDLPERTNLLDSPQGRNVLDSMRLRLGDALMPLRAVTEASPNGLAAIDPANDALFF